MGSLAGDLPQVRVHSGEPLVVAEQRDGITQKILWRMAQSLQTTSSITPALLKNVVATILLPNSIDTVNDPFANDIFYAASLDGSNGQYYMTMSAYTYISGKAGTSTNLSRGH